MIDIFGMSEEAFYKGCAGCEADKGLQKAVVAFGVLGDATIIKGTRGLLLDLKDAGIFAGDIWEAKDPGLYLWEGRVVYDVTIASPNGPEEYDVDYVGEFTEIDRIVGIDDPPKHTCEK